MEIARRRGMLPEKIQPRDYGLKHTLVGTTGKGGLNQSTGPWVALRDFPEGWQETAANFMPLEIVLLDGSDAYEQAVSLLLNGIGVGVGRMGHAIPWMIWNIERAHGYPDSYDVVRWDSKRTAQSAARGAFAILSVKSPDNWTNPAGNPQGVVAV
jgi:hypothetical protein